MTCRCYNDLPHLSAYVATEGDMSKNLKRRLDTSNDSLRKRRLLLRQGMGASQLDCRTEVSAMAIFSFIGLIILVTAYASVYIFSSLAVPSLNRLCSRHPQIISYCATSSVLRYRIQCYACFA